VTGAREPRESGQAIVIMLGVVLVTVAMLGVIVDGGNVLAQQRVTQNGADATAEAGAVILAARLTGAAEPSGGWDANIAAKLNQAAAANNMTVDVAYYTDICGIPLKADGSAALSSDHKEDLSAALTVGNATGELPGGDSTNPDCPNEVVGPVAGVMVIAEKVVGSFVARAINIRSFTVTTRATAVAGYLQGYCDASEAGYCAIFPLTFPVNVMSCNGNNAPIDSGVAWTFNIVVKVPLCSTAPGNVGFLDWDPPSGGAQELVCSILTADNPAIDLPSWQYVTQTGNTNGGGGQCGITVEDAIRTYAGRIVLIPQFDLTCGPSTSQPDPDSSYPAIVTGPNFGCPAGALGATGGSSVWYRMPSFAFFQLCSHTLAGCGGLEAAYISGSNPVACDTGNGATACIVGKFVHLMASGTVAAGLGSGTGDKAIGVQLIR
jgi:hypothetical protein